ncbi:putative nuclease HARBI1 [Phlebotomus papatasi]|uniref:putative nuclease HARBI1 n=1 Tax=Phlebotomus papatasi TaxID=29031 RepID=UPI002483CAF5|nr:putative nuclease HARBI1 [Phlebotomus papatasi]
MKSKIEYLQINFKRRQTNIFLYFSYFSQLNRIQLRALRDASNPFELPENTFRQIFVLTPNLALDLIDQLKSWDSSNNFESEVIPFHLKVLSTLHFYGKGSYQVSVGRNNMCNMSQATVSRCISYISGLIDDHLADQFIKFPTSQDEKRSISAGFQEQFDLNNIIGSIDCTHIAIVAPPQNDPVRPARLYRNRKHYTSINVGAICDSNLLFTWVNASFPGSTHDSGIWSKSPVRNHLLNSQEFILLADRGYPLEPFIFTPYADPATRAQHKFNRLHNLGRKVIERAFGILKSKFRCLLKHRTLHYYPTTAGKIINSCFTLYNYMKLRGVQFDDSEIEEINDDHNPVEQGQLYAIALELREEYANAL